MTARPTSSNGARRARLTLMVAASSCWLVLAGCQPHQAPRTESFELAEVAYRHGDYDAALANYQGFLQRYPMSPLAQMARLRVRCIEREVRAMLDRPDAPRPIYRAQRHDTTTDAPDAADSEPSPL